MDGAEDSPNGNTLNANCPKGVVNAVAGTASDERKFRVIATIVNPSDRIRPGMRGVAKLDVGERPLLDAWFARAIVPVKLWWWTWMP